MVVYSSLCDKNLVAYLAYLSVVSCGDEFLRERVSQIGSAGDGSTSSGQSGSGGDAADVFCRLYDKTQSGVAGVGSCSSVTGVRGYIRDVVGVEFERDEDGSAGVAGLHVGDGDGGVDGVVPVRDKVRSSDSGSSKGVPGSIGSIGNSGKKSKVRSTRRRRRERLSVEGVVVDSVPEWRKGAGPISETPSGFWNSCEPDVRKALIDSKARMHIAENERRAAEARKRVDYIGSPQAAVATAVQLVERARQYAADSDDSSVHGFAKTVVESEASSVIRSLPSSVTSFEDFERRKLEAECDRADKAERGLVDCEVKVAKLEEELRLQKGGRGDQRPVVNRPGLKDTGGKITDRRVGESAQEHCLRLRTYKQRGAEIVTNF